MNPEDVDTDYSDMTDDEITEMIGLVKFMAVAAEFDGEMEASRQFLEVRDEALNELAKRKESQP